MGRKKIYGHDKWTWQKWQPYSGKKHPAGTTRQQCWCIFRLHSHPEMSVLTKCSNFKYQLCIGETIIHYTAESITNRTFASLWSKMSTFLREHGAYKITAMPKPSLGFHITIETFQMRYCLILYLKGHQNCQKVKLKVFKNSPFIK